MKKYILLALTISCLCSYSAASNSNSIFKGVKKVRLNNVFINKILQGKDTPGSISVYWYSKEKDTPSEIISMLQSISNAVAPGLAKQKAFEMYAYALEKLNDAVEHPEHGSALITAILSLHVACCDMAEANPDAGLSRYRVIGDKFFLLAIKLKKAGKLEESQACIRMVLNYYKEGLVRVPDDLHDNWTEYSNGQTKDLRTDWKTTKEDEIELLGGMASLAMLK